MKGQYVIIDLINKEVMKDYWGNPIYYTTMEVMKDCWGNPIYYTTEEEACTVCGMYEFENAWVMQLIYNHIEKN